VTLSVKGFSQRITLNEKAAPLKSVLLEIREQSGYQLVFNSDLINQAGNISVQLRGATVVEALERVLAGLPLAFEMIDHMILIKPKTVPDISAAQAQVLPQLRLSGNVTDATGQPIVAASVLIK